MNQPPEGLLQFSCGDCGYDLEAPVNYAGVEAPCPMCGTLVRAPELPVEPPLGQDPGFWAAMEEATAAADEPLGWMGEAAWRQESPGYASGSLGVDGLEMTEAREARGELVEPEVPVFIPAMAPDGVEDLVRPREEVVVADLRARAESQPVFTPLPQRPPGPTREEEEWEAVARHRRKARRLLFFDAALVLLFLGMLALGGAAVAFTEPKQPALPKAPPELSELVVERMQQYDRQRDLAVEQARLALRELIGAEDATAAGSRLLPGSEKAPGLSWPLFAKAGADDFEFIQVKRIPGEDRFLTVFELASDPPLVLPVEETAFGARLHGLALGQQSGGLLAKFLASQGAGEGIFYVLLRPAPEPMAEELRGARPDLKPFELVAVEPAFPADGASGCLVCVDPSSEASAFFARRAHDPGLRPAVVKLAWRQHRESGNFVQLISFQPNAWSRH